MEENKTQNQEQPKPQVAPQGPQPAVAPAQPESALSASTPPASILEEEVAGKPSLVDRVRDLLASKGLIIGAVIVVIAIVAGVSVLFGFDAEDQYQGMIQKIEQDTAELNSN